MSITTSSPPNEGFTLGLVDEIMDELPLWGRNHLLLNWASQFASPKDDDHDPVIIEMFATITTLNFHLYLKIDSEKFFNLVHLPFSSHLAHLDLSDSQVGNFPDFSKFLSHSVFQHLVTLDLSATALCSFDPLLNTPHGFPHLRSLNLSWNRKLLGSTTIVINQFKQLIDLNLEGIDSVTAVLNAFLSPRLSVIAAIASTIIGWVSPAYSQPQHPSFHLEKLHVGIQSFTKTPFPAQLFSSPSLSKLRELSIQRFSLGASDIKSLFDNDNCKNLTHLSLNRCTLDIDAFQALTQSQYLSNLTSLLLPGFDFSTPPSIKSLYLSALLQSPHLWTSKLKHLTLNSFDELSTTAGSAHLATVLDTANIKLETLRLDSSAFDLDVLSTSSCFSQLKTLRVSQFLLGSPDSSEIVSSDEAWNAALERFAQSPTISNLTNFSIPELVGHEWSRNNLESLLTSPMMSNDLVIFQLVDDSEIIQNDLMESILTARVIPGDQTTPLKLSKLQQLNLAVQIDRRSVELIVRNLPTLTHLNLNYCEQIDDVAIALIAADHHYDPHYPYPALSNLVTLNLRSSSLSTEGCIKLSKSQLLDQLVSLNLTCSNNIGAKAIFKTPLFSKMELLMIEGSGEQIEVETHSFAHLDNCKVFQW